MPKLLNIWER